MIPIRPHDRNPQPDQPDRKVPTTRDMLHGALDGDQEQMARLAAHIWPRLRVIARKLLSQFVRERIDSQDAAQDAWIRIQRAIKDNRLDPDGSFWGYFITAVESVVRDTARAQEHRTVAPLEGQEQVASDGWGSVAVMEESREIEREMDRVFAQVNSEERQLLILRDLLRLSWDEVGASLGKSGEAARLQHKRLCQRLYTELAPPEEPEGGV